MDILEKDTNDLEWFKNNEGLDSLFAEIDDDELYDYEEDNSVTYRLDKNSKDIELPLIPIKLEAGGKEYYKYIYLSLPFYAETFDYLQQSDVLKIDISKDLIAPYLFPTGQKIQGKAVNDFLIKYVSENQLINKKINLKDLKQNSPIVDKLLTRWLMLT